MNEKTGLSNDVLIEIVHSIKDIIVALIDRAPQEAKVKRTSMKKSIINEPSRKGDSAWVELR